VICEVGESAEVFAFEVVVVVLDVAEVADVVVLEAVVEVVETVESDEAVGNAGVISNRESGSMSVYGLSVTTPLNAAGAL
jgi:hypothetical protein